MTIADPDHSDEPPGFMDWYTAGQDLLLAIAAIGGAGGARGRTRGRRGRRTRDLWRRYGPERLRRAAMDDWGRGGRLEGRVRGTLDRVLRELKKRGGGRSGGDAGSKRSRIEGHEPLPPFRKGEKTLGRFYGPDGRAVDLRSGVPGPAKTMPKGTSGFDIVTRTHVEGHAAAIIRQQGLREATVVINNPKICVSCEKLLPRMLPSGSRLRVILPDGSSRVFVGR